MKPMRMAAKVSEIEAMRYQGAVSYTHLRAHETEKQQEGISISEYRTTDQEKSCRE